MSRFSYPTGRMFFRLHGLLSVCQDHISDDACSHRAAALADWSREHRVTLESLYGFKGCL
jgi:hypothetical protein